MANSKPVLIVSGGTRGIGKAIVEKFAYEGFHIFTCSRAKENLHSLASEIAEKFPLAVLQTFQADLSQRQQVQKFAEFVLSNTTQIDVLVNNTGIFLPGQIHNEAEGTLESLMAINLYSAYHLTRALLPVFLKQKSGHIFNICSTASITAYTNGGSYCISKFALYGMTKVLREELKTHNIRVTAVLPGATLTESWAGVELPPERFMKPSDVAEAVWACYKLSTYSVVEEILVRPQLGDIT